MLILRTRESHLVHERRDRVSKRLRGKEIVKDQWKATPAFKRGREVQKKGPVETRVWNRGHAGWKIQPPANKKNEDRGDIKERGEKRIQ